MRISDWSSDVCSSDLPDNWVELRNAQIRDLTPEQVNTAARTLDPGALTWVVVGDLDKIEQPVRALDLGKVSIIDADGQDRKSVVKGKSVSVRVDLGGRRLIKKKNI